MAVPNMPYHNDAYHTHQNSDPQVEVPEAVDSERSPQLDKIKSRDRCGCTCACSRANNNNNGDDGGGGTPGQAFMEDTSMRPSASVVEVDNTFDDSASVRGDEGIEEHSIQVAHHGMVRICDIHMALARHDHCTCHTTLLRQEHRQDQSGSPSDSMMVEAGGDSSMQRSVMSSLSSLGHITRNTSASALVAHAGGGFSDQPQPTLPHFIGQPIWLGHEFILSSSMLSNSMRYPIELTMTDESVPSDFSDFDMW